MRQLVFRLQFFDARPDVRIAFVGLGVFARVVEYFHPGPRMRTLDRRFHLQVGLGALEIEVVEGINPGLDLLRNRPFMDVIFFAAQVLVRREKRQFFAAGKGLMGADRIGQHQLVLVAFVFEVIVDALLLHEPADEVEIRFAVLDTVEPFSIGAAERFFEVRKTVVPEHLLDDVGNRHLLKDPAVGGAG